MSARTRLTLHVVRHGQSTWNAEGRLQGQLPDPELTALGRSQAAQAAQDIARAVAGATVCVWSSDLVRARQSAQVIAARLHVPVRQDEALREQDLGERQGRLISELGPAPAPPGVHPTEVRWPGGESVADVYDRVCRWLPHALGTGHEHVAVVSHGDTIRVLLAVLRGGGHRDVDLTENVRNGSVTVVRIAR